MKYSALIETIGVVTLGLIIYGIYKLLILFCVMYQITLPVININVTFNGVIYSLCVFILVTATLGLLFGERN